MVDEHSIESELFKGIWLSEQTPEKQASLVARSFENWDCAKLIILIGKDEHGKFKNFYHDFLFEWNQNEAVRHARRKAEEHSIKLVRLDVYDLDGKWFMSQYGLGSDGAPEPKKYLTDKI